MLVPTTLRANYKVGASQLDVQLESLLGSNLPLLFPTVTVMCRTDSVGVVHSSTVQFSNQADPDFNGSVVKTNSAVSLTSGTQADIPVGNALHTPDHGVSNTLSITKAGPAAEAQVSIFIQGMIETSISPDANTSINV